VGLEGLAADDWGGGVGVSVQADVSKVVHQDHLLHGTLEDVVHLREAVAKRNHVGVRKG